MGELRGFSSDGKEVFGINAPSEANHVDLFATDLGPARCGGSPEPNTRTR